MRRAIFAGVVAAAACVVAAGANETDDQLMRIYKAEGMNGVTGAVKRCYAKMGRNLDRAARCTSLDMHAYMLDRTAQKSLGFPPSPGHSRYETRTRMISAMKASGAKPAEIDPTFDAITRAAGGYALELR